MSATLLIEEQVLSHMIDNNSLPEFTELGVNADYFVRLKDEYRFILEHYNKYGRTPDLLTFGASFPNFDVQEVLEPIKYLVDELREQFVYELGREVMIEGKTKLEGNSYEGLHFLVERSTELLEKYEKLNEVKSMNALKDEFNEWLEDTSQHETIKTGLTDLDYAIGGFNYGEELVTIVGRLGHGKSWLLQKFLSEAHNQGKKVLHYSGEMSNMQVLTRHIAISLGISTKDIEDKTISEEERKQIEELLSSENYNLITYNSLQEPLDIPKLEAYIQRFKPDIVGIDQLSLMRDYRHKKGDNIKISYANISQDLFKLSCKYQIPILLLAQANRGRASEEALECPEITNVANSDDVAQNSSRVISLATKDSQMKIKVIKNRFGNTGDEFKYNVNFDKGNFNSTIKPRSTNTKKKYGKDEF